MDVDDNVLYNVFILVQLYGVQWVCYVYMVALHDVGGGGGGGVGCVKARSVLRGGSVSVFASLVFFCPLFGSVCIFITFRVSKSCVTR